VLGLDVGVNNEVLYGETGEGRMSARAEERMLKWGDRIDESEEGMIRRGKAREASGKDKWKKYEETVKSSLEREGVKERVGRRNLRRESMKNGGRGWTDQNSHWECIDRS
jgi:hypothetical protein